MPHALRRQPAPPHLRASVSESCARETIQMPEREDGLRTHPGRGTSTPTCGWASLRRRLRACSLRRDWSATATRRWACSETFSPRPLGRGRRYRSVYRLGTGIAVAATHRRRSLNRVRTHFNVVPRRSEPPVALRWARSSRSHRRRLSMVRAVICIERPSATSGCANRPNASGGASSTIVARARLPSGARQ